MTTLGFILLLQEGTVNSEIIACKFLSKTYPNFYLRPTLIFASDPMHFYTEFG